MKITFFKSEWDVYTPAEMMIDMDWDSVANILTSVIEVLNKEDTEMYNLWEFKTTPDGEIHRCKDNCIALHGLVLDYDINLTLEQAIDRFESIECVIYTTFNHGKNGVDKFRVVLPFTQPLSVEDFTKKRASMIEHFVGADRASFSRSQAIFLHSGPDANNTFAVRMNGYVIDPTAFEDEEVIEYELNKPAITDTADAAFQAAYKTAVITALAKCSGIRHMNSLSLAIILKSCGAKFADYRRIVAVAGAMDSCIHDHKNQTDTWAAVADDVKIKREKRDAFIIKFGGEPMVIKRTNVLESKINELKRKLKNEK